MPRWPQRILLATIVVVGLTYSHSIIESTRVDTTEPYSANALDALLEVLRDADVDTGDAVIRVSGVTSDANWSQLLEKFRSSLADDVELQLDVFVLQGAADRRQLCARMFAALAIETPSFGEAGTDLRPASVPTLDRLAEFARDCRHARILITGHSDSTGVAALNRQLSLDRAQAVADYLIAQGAADEQLQVRGLGSDQPIADDATRAGRARNRRIEFELLEQQ